MLNFLEISDPGDYNTSSVIPNNKLIIRGLAPHLTEADVSTQFSDFLIKNLNRFQCYRYKQI